MDSVKTAPEKAPVTKKQKPLKAGPLKTFLANWELLLLCVPSVVLNLVFHYIPLTGIIMAFKDYNLRKGIWGSDWAGFVNFKMMFMSTDFPKLLRNTVCYSLWFLFIGMVANVIVALLLFEINNKTCLKVYQTIITFPNFLSMVIVGFITFAILHPQQGFMNSILVMFGGEHGAFDVYGKPGVWPFILTVVNIWKGVGMGCILYYANLIGIDTTLYEAAVIDGANRWQQTWHISLPSLIPLIAIQLIMGVGSTFNTGLDLFYQIPRNQSILYETTDVIATYIYRGLTGSNYEMSTALGLMQSVAGLFMVVGVNAVVRKISPENSMF